MAGRASKTERPILTLMKLSVLLAMVAMPIGAAAHSESSVLKTQEGTATYYAKMLDGRTTASGVAFDQDALMAAHHRWPFGTEVRVVNPENERSVRVLIVDRLAKRSRAVIDLSRRAARELRFLRTGDGRIPVRLEVLKWGEQ